MRLRCLRHPGPSRPHMGGEGPELQIYWAEQENYIYLYKHLIVTYLKYVIGARSRGAARQSHQLPPVPCAKLGHRETAATQGSFTTSSATHAQTSPSRKNRRLKAPTANRTAQQSPPPLRSPASPSSPHGHSHSHSPVKTALGLVGSTNKFY